ncbi:hypothetical protein HOK00_02045 [bacterium]|nr:hypothetical protein [bacterium]
MTSTNTNIGENITLNFLQKNYGSVETNDSHKGSIANYSLSDWNTYITSIALISDAKLSEKAINVLCSLESLQEIDLKSYNCSYELSNTDLINLDNAGINIIFDNRKYINNEINARINKDKLDILFNKRNDLYNDLDLLNAQIYDLGGA